MQDWRVTYWAQVPGDERVRQARMIDARDADEAVARVTEQCNAGGHKFGILGVSAQCGIAACQNFTKHESGLCNAHQSEKRAAARAAKRACVVLARTLARAREKLCAERYEAYALVLEAMEELDRQITNALDFVEKEDGQVSTNKWSIVAMNMIGGRWKIAGDENVKAEEYIIESAHASVGAIYRQADAKRLRAMIEATDPLRIPLVAVTPHCVAAGCNDNAHGWLIAPDGKVAPGGAYCRRHLFDTIDEYAAKVAEAWTIAPLMFPCQHSCDPRLCAEKACVEKRS